MEFNELLTIVGDEPLFDSSILLAGDVNPRYIRLQLNRWVRSGKILQLRRGLYCLVEPYQKTRPHPFLIANRLKKASYVSLQSALAYYGMIPEQVNVVTSVTSGRPERLQTPLGVFEYRHINTSLLSGYRSLDMNGQPALVATPEKALLDLAYLQTRGSSPEFLQSLRLQNLDLLDQVTLVSLAGVFSSPRMRSVPGTIQQMAEQEGEEYEVV